MKKSRTDNTSVFDAHRQNFIGKVFSLSHYQVIVEDVIAEGGFALVFLVRSVRSDERFALKRLCVNNDQDLAVARREIKIAHSLSGHKNIVSYIDSKVSKLNPDVYEVLLLMQYCQGRLISQMAERQPLGGLSEKDILRVFCDVCEAIAQFHHSQPPIIHRDIKAENVLLSSSGHYVLCDFGSAAGVTHTKVNIQQLQEEIARYTTVSYRSPEMVDLYSGKTISTKADIWALGCFLYRLCFSTLPFGDSMLAIQSGAFTMPDSSPYSQPIHALIGYLLEVDCDKRPDIYQVSAIAFKLAHKPCPVPNVHKVSVPDILSLPLPLTESEAKQINVRQSSSRKGAGMAADIESTSVKPRQRPRAAESSMRQPQQPAVSTSGMSEPPVATSSAVVSAAVTAAAVNASRQQQQLIQHQHLQQQSQPQQQQLKSEQQPQIQQEPLLLLSDQPQWPDERHVSPPGDDSGSLIDLDPASTILANLDPLTPSVSAIPATQFTAVRQFRPPFGGNVSPADPFSSSVGRFNSPSMQSNASNFMAYRPGFVPRQLVSYPMHGCAQQAIGHPSAMPYSTMRLMTPQNHGVIPQVKTGSNNDLHLLQGNDGMAGQRHLVMKHRRIVSDTSALNLPMSLMLLPQQQGTVMPPVSTNLQDAPLQPSVQHHLTVTSRTSDSNPFANDNFGSLSAEDIVAQQFDQLQMSNKHMAHSVGDLQHTSHSAVVANPTQLGVPSQPSSSNQLSVFGWR